MWNHYFGLWLAQYQGRIDVCSHFPSKIINTCPKSYAIVNHPVLLKSSSKVTMCCKSRSLLIRFVYQLIAFGKRLDPEDLKLSNVLISWDHHNMMAILGVSKEEHLVGLWGYALVQKHILSPEIVCVSASWTEQLCSVMPHRPWYAAGSWTRQWTSLTLDWNVRNNELMSPPSRGSSQVLVTAMRTLTHWLREPNQE